MMYYTHLALAIFFGLFTLNYFYIPYAWLFMLVVIVSGFLPDIDAPNSKIGRKFKPISWLLKFFFGHRKLIHSIFIPIILFIMFWFVNLKFVAWGILIGWISHLVGDMLTKEGILPFYPIKLKLRGLIKTAGLIEKILFVIIILLDVCFLVRLFI